MTDLFGGIPPISGHLVFQGNHFPTAILTRRQPWDRSCFLIEHRIGAVIVGTAETDEVLVYEGAGLI